MRFKLHIPLLALAILMQSGCDQSTGPAVGSVPSGRWVHDTTLNASGEERRVVSVMVLSTADPGRIYDTTFVRRNNVWEIDSTTETLLNMTSVGDGYLRTHEVRRRNGEPPDTTLRYWYFYSRNDSLHFYRGMRFIGKGLSLAGDWGVDSIDRVPTGIDYSLRFDADSVDIQNGGTGGPATGRYHYQTSGSLLTIEGASLGFGPRYEIVPGWSLYSTSIVQSGYRRQR